MEMLGKEEMVERFIDAYGAIERSPLFESGDLKQTDKFWYDSISKSLIAENCLGEFMFWDENDKEWSFKE